DTIECSWRNIDTCLAGYGNGTRLAGMLELTVTTFGPRQKPAVFFKKSNDVLNFHVGNNKVSTSQREAA
ncbi:MAG TPA: hypothetical protein VJ180_05315, partial [Pyrinomonadaceae bacterium]|nr:hypothetical protein [Pyrinomonadaceae bacterium]